MVWKLEGRARRKFRIRKKISGTTDKPRLTVFRSARHIYVQVVDDTKGATLAAASTLQESLKAEAGQAKKTDAAKAVGAAIAGVCLGQGIKTVVFDRNGFIYHGRIRALAEAAREAGLKF